jgi:hypothetical protein
MSSTFSTATLGSTDSIMEDSLDDILARKSALSFLCRMNADYREIERFLATFPEALLFESTEDCDLERTIYRQMEECKCFSRSCNQNREHILRVLRRGFEFHRGVRLVNSCDAEFLQDAARRDWSTYSPQLRELERDIRILKTREGELENRLILALQEVSYLRRLVELDSKRRQHGQIQSHLVKLHCRKAKTHAFEERASLENRLAVATLTVSSIEKGKHLLRVETATAIGLRHALLKKSFSGCQRHICNASRLETNS